MACPGCGCPSPAGAGAHAVVAALAGDDFDAALAHGLLDAATDCPHCSAACLAQLEAARRHRASALAARERHRARTERLARRQRERAERSRPVPASGVATGGTPALPAAAAAALARAKARAAGHGGK